MKRMWILLVVFTVMLSTASISHGLTYADTSSPPVFTNIGIATGQSNLGSIADGNYLRLTSDGTFGDSLGRGEFTMAFDFFNQGSSNISQVLYTGYASQGVSVTVVQVDFFSSQSTNNQATITLNNHLSFITSPSVMCVQNRLTTDGYYFFHDGVLYFLPPAYTFQSNFSFSDIVRVQYTFSVTGYTNGKFFEFDTVSNTNDPVPLINDPVPIPTSSVPEPTTMLLLGLGLIGLVGIRRKIQK